MLTLLDHLAGRLARGAATLGQAGLVALGVHQAADILDDVLASRLMAVGPVPFAPEIAAGWVALAWEGAVLLALLGAILLAPLPPGLQRGDLRRLGSLGTFTTAVALALAVVAGAWSCAMAVEDLLPVSGWARVGGTATGWAAVLRFGWPALLRAVHAMDPVPPASQGWRRALLLAPLCAALIRGGLPLPGGGP